MHAAVAYLASLAVRCLSSTVEPKVSESMSSVAVAYTFPAFTMAAHWASASHGACRTQHHHLSVSNQPKLWMTFCDSIQLVMTIIFSHR